MCFNFPCIDHNILPDIAHAGFHSFIQEECSTSTKYLTQGQYASLVRHNISKIFPKLKDIIDSSFFNVKMTRKVLPAERNIYKVVKTFQP